MLIRTLTVLSFLVSPAAVRGAGPVQVIADFSTPVDDPLSKSKFAVFNSGMVRPDRYERDTKWIEAVHPESMRIDIGWGARWIGWKTPAVSGTADVPRYDFAEMDRTAVALRSAGVPVYWSYCYTPRPLQPAPGDYRGMPTDLKAYGRIIRDVTAHYRDLPGGDPVGYHEIGNEPDNRDFFTGTRDNYLDLYETGSRAVRDANPDARVGGPALAFDPSWVDPFLDRVTAKKIPLDFFSFHYYPGIPFQPADLPGRVKLMEEALDKRPGLRTTQLHLNEFNSYRIDYPKGGKQDRLPIAAAFLHDVKWFLEQPGLTRVNWAQFMDSGGGNFSGMISMDGHRKALFNAYLLYSRMPTDRRAFSSDSGDVEGLASEEHGAAAALMWNRGDVVRTVTVRTIAAPRIAPTITRIDTDHGSWGDQPEHEATSDEKLSQAGDGTYTVELPAGGVALIDFEPVNIQPDPVPAGRIIHDLYDYPKRTGKPYMDVDRRTWTIRAGSAGDADACCTAGFNAVGLPPVLSVVTDLGQGKMVSGLLALRIDFKSPGGRNTAVVYHGPIGGTDHFPVGAAVDVPWGTGRPAERVIAVADFARFRADLKSVAPPDWEGRADISLVMRDAGPAARVVVSVEK